MDEIPGPADWVGCTSDPDCYLVYEKFRGKSNDDIQGLLRENFIMRCMDWGLMPSKPFDYYFCGFQTYLLSKKNDPEELGFSIARVLDAIDSHFDDHPDMCVRFWRGHELSIQLLEGMMDDIRSTQDVREEISRRILDIRGLLSKK